MRVLGRAIAAMRPDPWRLALATLTGSAALAMTIALMGTSGWLISRAAQRPPVMYLMVAVVAVRAFGIGRGVLRYAERLAAHDVALRGVVALRETLYLRLAAADPTTAARLRRGDLLARVGADVDTVGDVVVRSLLPFATAALTGGLSVVAVALVLPQAGVILAVGLLVGGVGAPILAGLASQRGIRDTAAARTAMSTEVLALLDGLPELAVAGVVTDRLDHLERTDQALNRGQDRAARPAAWSAALSTASMLAAVIGCLAVGVQAVSAGRLAPVLLAVVTLVPLAVAEVVAALPAAAASLVRSHAAAERVVQLLDAPPASDQAGARSARRSLAPGAHLRAENLACGWPGGPSALSEIDLDLPGGRRIAIVGPSGAGKTTLLLTLAGLLPARAGRVLLGGADGTDLAELDPEIRHQAINFVADDAHVFTTTVRENLRLVGPGASDVEIASALQRAGLGAWLEGLPAKLDTMISDPAGPAAGTGTPLSGGERRRLIVARALLSGSGVLLVDEPAEHLDPATADALVEELFATGATVVVVTHRLSPLSQADEILFVANGRITARGGHDQLIASHAPYREAWLAEQDGTESGLLNRLRGGSLGVVVGEVGQAVGDPDHAVDLPGQLFRDRDLAAPLDLPGHRDHSVLHQDVEAIRVGPERSHEDLEDDLGADVVVGAQE
jgi:ATP-binding cassette subfamily C protein CydC